MFAFSADPGPFEGGNTCREPAKFAASGRSGPEKFSLRFQWISFHDLLTMPT
jgi:hypothetical protein